MMFSFASVAYITYDAAGNRTQAIIDTTTTISYTYNTAGQLAYEISNNGSTSETTTYSYDLNGNLTAESKGVSTTSMISLPKEVHKKLSKFYSSIPNQKLVNTGGKVFRDWLSDKSFEEQFEYGIWVISYVMNSMGG